MTLYAIFAGLFAVALVFVVWPRRQRTADAGQLDQLRAHLKRQLAQIDEDLADGRISPSEADGARLETSRLALAEERHFQAMPGFRPGGRLGIVAIALIAFGSVPLIYGQVGSPGQPDQPLAMRSDIPPQGHPTALSEHNGEALADSIAALKARLEETPDDEERLLLLAKTYSAIGDYASSAKSMQRLLDLTGPDATLMGDYAEAMVRAADGQVDARSAKVFQDVLGLEPKNARAKYYIALGDAQSGLSEQAVRGWVEILRDAPADASYVPAIRQIVDAVIEDAGLDAASFDLPEQDDPRGPSQADIAAASQMSDEDQLEMIRGMVANLEARLEDNPGDVGGWLKLLRSREVLGEPQKLADAIERALEAHPDNPELLAYWDRVVAGQ